MRRAAGSAQQRTRRGTGVRLAIAAFLAIACAGQPAWAQGDNPFQKRGSRVTRTQAQALSALFPGLGQLAMGHTNKGTVLMTGGAATVVVWITSHMDFNTLHEQFDVSEARYLALREGGSYTQAEEAWQDMKGTKDDLDRAHTLRTAFGALSIALYAYNLADVLWLDGAEPNTARLSLAPAILGPDAAGAALVARF